MSNTDNAKLILIRRYSRLSNVSVEKTLAKFENTPIDEVIEKHQKTIIFSIVLFIIVITGLIVQFVSLYLSNNVTFSLILNILVLIIFQKGLHDNYEIKEILKTLKEIGIQ
jgi:hypothetical protein